MFTSNSLADLFDLRTSLFKANDVADAIDAGIRATWGGTTSGSATAYACSPTPAWATYAAGDWIVFVPHAANTGAVTLNVSGLGAKSVYCNGAACTGYEWKAGVPVLAYYDSTQFQGVSLGNFPFKFDSSGNCALGASAPASLQKLDVLGRIRLGSGNNDAELSWREHSSSSNIAWLVSVRNDLGGSNQDLKFFALSGGSISATALQMGISGQVYFPAVGTTASAANAFLNNASTPAANSLLRSTSSARYKKDVEDLEGERADAVLALRPVWYRSKAEADPEGWSWYGLIAEEAAEVDPRLVHWGYAEDAFEEVEVELPERDEEGRPRIFKDRRLKSGAEKVPDAVMYDRVGVLLLDVVRRQRSRIDDLEARLAALEARAA